MKPPPLVLFLLSYFLVSPSHTIAVDKILFLGLSADGAPAIEQTFDRLLRDRLSVDPGFAVIDYIETLRCRKHIGFNNHTTVSVNMLTGLNTMLPDSVLIVWGSIKRVALEQRRRKLIKAVINAELTVHLSVYNLVEGLFAYSGDIQCFLQKPKGFIFFTPVKETPPIGASQRAAIIDELIEDAAAKSAGIISSLVRSVQLRTAPLQARTDSANGRSPSISDVFTVPSVEPPVISNNPPIESRQDSTLSESRRPAGGGNNKSSTGTK